MHVRRHGGERKHALHAQSLGKLDQPVTEHKLAGRWLRFANEDDDIMLSFGVLPYEQPTSRHAARPDHAVLDFHVLHLEQFARREFGQQMHAELGHHVIAGTQRHVSHSRPHGD